MVSLRNCWGNMYIPLTFPSATHFISLHDYLGIIYISLRDPSQNHMIPVGNHSECRIFRRENPNSIFRNPGNHLSFWQCIIVVSSVRFIGDTLCCVVLTCDCLLARLRHGSWPECFPSACNCFYLRTNRRNINRALTTQDCGRWNALIPIHSQWILMHVSLIPHPLPKNIRPGGGPAGKASSQPSRHSMFVRCRGWWWWAGINILEGFRWVIQVS